MRQMPDDDDDLVRDMAAGREAALARLVARHAAGVRNVALRFLGNAADADEVVQDVFVRVWDHAGRFDPDKASFASWLYRIAANRCLDMLRRRKRWSWPGLDAAAERAAADIAADEALSQRQTLAIVRQDILDLPERQRMALVLVVVAERSAQEVAEALGITRGAAEQLIVRARQTLRDRQRERARS